MTMNFNLSAGASSRKVNHTSNQIQTGLNKRGEGGGERRHKSVFDDEEGDGDDEKRVGSQKPSSFRSSVNEEIAQEQEALRKRAKQALPSTEEQHAVIYDYDGSYDSFRHSDTEAEKVGSGDEPRKSRYMEDLLKAAQNRKREHDIVYERKIAREQAAEEEVEDLRGKDKFVTTAYKKALQERELWKARDEEQRRKEEEDDVTKKSGGVALANFYGNLNRNVAMGGDRNEHEANKGRPPTNRDDEQAVEDDRKNFGGGDHAGFLDGFSKEDDNGHGEAKSGEPQTADLPKNKESQDDLDPAVQRLYMRKMREEKVAAARIRYFQRHGMTMPEVIR